MTSGSAANLRGHLLVASPHLTDGNFFRTVVLIIRHDRDGAFGLVLNRPTEQRFLHLVELSLPSSSTKTPATIREDDWIHCGGPVGGTLLALHDLAGVGEPVGLDDESSSGPAKTQVTIHSNPAEPFGSMSLDFPTSAAWITGDEDHLRLLHQRSDVRVRYIADYSGWGAGQLEHELRLGGWLSCPATAELAFAANDDVWQKCVDQCGREIFGETIPGMNTVSSMVN